MGHQPVVHFLAGGLGEGEDFFVFHLAFFVAVFAVPALAFHGAFVEVDLFLVQHDDRRGHAKAERAEAPRKDVVVFKAVQHRQK